jgi:hypothetical protein
MEGKTMKNAKQRVIYDNYDLWEQYAEDARAALELDYNPEEITDCMIWDEIYFYDENTWGEEFHALSDFFDGKSCLLVGTVGRWNGTFSAGTVFYDFEKMFYEAVKDCDYWKIWDENGRFFLECSHHDGTNMFEIKEITDKGISLLDKWEYDFNDPRTEEQIHETIFNNNFYSRLLHYAHKQWGCKKEEYNND